MVSVGLFLYVLDFLKQFYQQELVKESRLIDVYIELKSKTKSVLS